MTRRPEIRRRTANRLLGGVASGIADSLQLDPMLVRLAFVVLTLASGVGLALYAAAWALIPADDGGEPILSRARVEDHESDVVRGLAFGSIVLGVVLAIRSVGLWFPATLLWPIVITAAGLAMVWRRPAGAKRTDIALRYTAERGLPGLLDDTRELLSDGSWSRRTATRVASGAFLVLLGAATFIATNGSFAALRQGLLAFVVLAVGLALIVAPWLMRLLKDLGEERRERIRNEERALLAAHLHDSVLQTLAIIQKRAHDPRDVVTLARRQERELRTWLYGGTDVAGAPSSFAEAIAAAAEQVENDHGVRVEVVQVGDAPMSDTVTTVVAAAREAMVNAAKHAKVDEVSVYAEVDEQDGSRVLEVFVRDRGIGFDPSTVATDRRGLADSVRARMERIDGRADVHSEPGEGTEVRLEVVLAPTPPSADVGRMDSQPPRSSR